MTIRALYNTIVFQFEDTITNKGEFQSTHSIFWIRANFDESAKRPRWGIVVSAGPDCTDLLPGDRVLLPALRWTSGATYQDQRYWKTDETQIVLRDRAGDISIRNKFIVFEPLQSKVDVMSGIILLAMPVPDSPMGRVRLAAEGTFTNEDSPTELVIRYDDKLFEDVFSLGDDSLSFIKQDHVLCYEHVAL